MSGILRLENLNKGTTLKQGDKTVLSYRLSDADGEILNIAGNTAVARLMHTDFTRIGYESEALTVSADNIVQFSIDSIIPSRLYYLEITVDGQYIFPSRSDEGKLSIDRSSMGAEITIIENAGIDAVVRKAVDLINEDPSLIIDEDKLISEIIANTSVGSIEEYYQEYRDAIKEYADLKPKALSAISKSDEALTKSQNALNVANGIDAKATNALSLSESADTLSKSVQEQFNQVIIDGDSSVEAAQARVDASGQTNPTLKARLDKEHNEVTAQLAQKVDMSGSGQVKWANISQDARLQISGDKVAVVGDNSVINSNITDNAVDGRTLDEATKTSGTVNLFNKNDIITGGYYSSTSGNWVPDPDYVAPNLIPVEQNTTYRKSVTGGAVFYDKYGGFLANGGTNVLFSTTPETFYVSFPVGVSKLDTFMLTKSYEWPSVYVPYVKKYKLSSVWDISDAKNEIVTNSIGQDKLVDVIKTSKTANLFNKENAILGFYHNHGEQGKLTPYATLGSTGFIPVEPLTMYQRTTTTSYCLWDENFKFISGGSGAPQTFKTTENTKYATATFIITAIDSFMFTKASEYGDEYIPYEEGYVFGDSWVINSSLTATAEDFFLRIPTPYNDGSDNPWSDYQTTHPSVYQFDEPWNGYKYWLAHTPYPNGLNPYENPCVAVSNNGIKWENPVGARFPLAEKPADGYNSDTHIFYNDSTNKLEIWYREWKSAIEKETLFRVTSSDGSDWSVPEEMVSVTGKGPYNLISPSLIFTDNEYKMWIMRDSYIAYTTSPDGKIWSEPVDVLSNGQKIWSWHANVVLHDGKYHMLNRRDGYVIRYSFSEPGNETEFSEQEVIFGITGNEWELDGDFLYRASPIFTDRSVIVLYGAVSKEHKWTMQAVSGRDFYNLKPITQKAFDFYGIE